jgi:hypothetical protein
MRRSARRLGARAVRARGYSRGFRHYSTTAQPCWRAAIHNTTSECRSVSLNSVFPPRPKTPWPLIRKDLRASAAPGSSLPHSRRDGAGGGFSARGRLARAANPSHFAPSPAGALDSSHGCRGVYAANPWTAPRPLPLFSPSLIGRGQAEGFLREAGWPEPRLPATSLPAPQGRLTVAPGAAASAPTRPVDHVAPPLSLSFLRPGRGGRTQSLALKAGPHAAGVPDGTAWTTSTHSAASLHKPALLCTRSVS